MGDAPWMPATVDLPDEANPVLERLFREWAQVPLDDEPAWITYARKVVAYAHTDQAEVAPFVSGLEAALVDRWGTGEGDVESRKRLHDTARTTTALGGATANEVRRLLGKDLSDELQQGSSPGMLDAVEELAVELSLDETKEVAKQVRRSDPASSPEEAADELAVVAGLALEAKSWGGNEWQAPEFALPYSDTVAHILGTSAAPKVLERWLRLDPPQGDVRTALRTYPDTPTVGLREAIEEWAGGQKRTHLMPLAKSLLNQNKNNSPVLEAVTSGDVAQMPLAKELEKRIDAAGSSDLRRRYATKTAALRLEVPQARNKVADVALARLKSGVKSDIPVAVELVAGLGKPLPKLPALRKAFAQAGHKFSADEAAKLASVEIIPPEDSLPKKFLKKFLGS